MRYTHRRTDIDYLERLARHVQAENRARVGYPYPEREENARWVLDHLPQTFEDFYALLQHLRRMSWSPLAVELAAILLGTQTHASETTPVLCLCDAQQADADHWARVWRVPRTNDVSTWEVACTPMHDRQVLLALIADLALATPSPAIAHGVSRALALIGHPHAPRLPEEGTGSDQPVGDPLWCYLRDNRLFHGTLDDSVDSAWRLYGPAGFDLPQHLPPYAERGMALLQRGEEGDGL